MNSILLLLLLVLLLVCFLVIFWFWFFFLLVVYLGFGFGFSFVCLFVWLVFFKVTQVVKNGLSFSALSTKMMAGPITISSHSFTQERSSCYSCPKYIYFSLLLPNIFQPFRDQHM